MGISMFLIRKATLKDAARIAHVHFHSWNDAYRDLLPRSYIYQENNLSKKISMWAQILLQPNVDVWVAHDDRNKILGFIGHYGQNHCYEITTLYVLPDCHCQGVGSSLMKRSLETISKSDVDANFYLWVLSTNMLAINFYRKNDFEYSGESNEEIYEGTKIIDIKMVKKTSTLDSAD